MTGNITSISYMFSTPWVMNATRSRPMPVSMFFFGSEPTMSKSSLDRTALSSSCMKTRFQNSRYRSSAPKSPSAPYAGPRSIRISEHGPPGPGTPIDQ